MRAITGTSVLVLVLLIGFSNSLYGTKNDKEAIQFSGTVKNEKGKHLPFVHILDINTGKGMISDQNGMFSFVVHSGDSVMFSSVGYGRKIVEVPDTNTDIYYFKDVLLERDTVQIKKIDVFPWGTYKEFKRAFLQLDLSTKSQKHARKNLQRIQRQITQKSYQKERDPRLNYDFMMEEQHERTYIKGQYPSVSLLNPVAWSQFFEALKNGEFSE